MTSIKARLCYETAVFFNAWVYFLRLPAPGWVPYSGELSARAGKYFPLIGLLIGAVAAAVFYLAGLVLPPPLAVLLSMLASILLTGGLHEDGLADCSDGFGGGWDKAQVLAIMKDPRLGSYGALALFFGLTVKFTSLLALADTSRVWLVLISGHVLSRLAALLLMNSQPYVGDSSSSKSRSMVTPLSRAAMAFAAACAGAPLLLMIVLESFSLAIFGILMVGLLSWALSRYFYRRIGGFTGDCLGAVQQLTELAFYLTWIVHG